MNANTVERASKAARHEHTEWYLFHDRCQLHSVLNMADGTYQCRRHDPIFRSPRPSAYSTIHPHSKSYKGENSQSDDTACQIWRIIRDYGHGFRNESRRCFVLYAKSKYYVNGPHIEGRRGKSNI